MAKSMSWGCDIKTHGGQAIFCPKWPSKKCHPKLRKHILWECEELVTQFGNTDEEECQVMSTIKKMEFWTNFDRSDVQRDRLGRYAQQRIHEWLHLPQGPARIGPANAPELRRNKEFSGTICDIWKQGNRAGSILFATVGEEFDALPDLGRKVKTKRKQCREGEVIGHE